MCLTLDSHVASCAAHELALSRIFRKKFLKYAKSKVGLSHSFNNVDDHEDVKLVWIPFVIEIQLEYPKQKIDYSWFYRIQSLVILKLKTEESMALLSTLGGGFSALGDYYEKHSLEAGKIALRQLKIAFMICDPLIAARCYLYIALSLMQRGYLKKSKLIIRKQYSFAKDHFIKDYRLIAMCRGLWSRLQFMYYLHRLKRQGIACSVQHGVLTEYYSDYNTCNAWSQTSGQDENRISVDLGAS
ncbi:unnamed protein product [Acanthosepion pharaonis]|uniref:Uncharacterized protein n=1 Tax=Acanthosepion pharaonis TaxID=158019 RepID=A0A812C6Z7_ACAPH|nr:unnamed protein product [Sepia pharaonis]